MKLNQLPHSFSELGEGSKGGREEKQTRSSDAEEASSVIFLPRSLLIQVSCGEVGFGVGIMRGIIV